MQSSGKCAQNNIATSPGEFQKLGTKRYQSDKLSFEFKIIILERLILNSGSAAVLSLNVFPQNASGASVFAGWPLCPSQPRPGLSNKVWQSVLGCCCCVPTRGRGFSECSVSVELHRAVWLPWGTPVHAEGREPFLFRAEHPLLCLCCLCCLSSPPQSVIVAPQSNCHTVNLLSPLLQLGSATE